MWIWDVIVNSYQGYAKVFWEAITTPFRVDNYFYFLIYISLFVWLLEILLPWRKNQRIFRKDFWLDAFFMFFNFYIFNLIVFVALSNVSAKLFGKMMGAIGLPSDHLFDLTALPVAASFIVFFLISDFTQWGVHNLLHRVPWLWKFHKVHHSVREMGFAAHLRYHFMENVVYKTFLYIVLGYIFNFKLENAFLLHFFTILIGHLNHANLNLDYGPLKYILNNPKMHIWHHAKELPKHLPKGMNFGITLSTWDYLFKTAYIPHSGRDIELGFDGVEEYPQGFFELQLDAFKPEKK